MSQPTAPRLVSVIIGTYNRPDTLRVALQSIRALEGPDLTFEILVGDNGKSPETRAVVEEFGGIYDKTDVRGCPAARNLAMRRMKGEFVAFLDDDDAWMEGHIRPHIAMLDGHPEFAAVFGQIVLAGSDLKSPGMVWPESMPADGDFFVTMMSGYFPQVGATVVRGDIARGYGVMDETLIGDSDWDWQLQIARDHKIGFVAVPCVLFRERPKGTYDNLQVMRTSYTRRIWKRHAGPNKNRWPNAMARMRSYNSCVQFYWMYFCEAAEYRIGQGNRGGAIKAAFSAFRIIPTRTLRLLVRKSPFRAAVLRALMPGRLKRTVEPAAQATQAPQGG